LKVNLFPPIPYEVVSLGISLVPEGRRVFANLTVYENLLMGAFPRKDRENIKSDLEWVYSSLSKTEREE